MSTGVSAIGSTRPRAPSSRPTQSRAATWSPSCSQRLTIRRLPTTWPFISPVPAKRCCRTFAQVSPHSSSPQSAASAIRRSPGGRTPNSERSRPDDPPSSATVTTAVRSTGSRRRADSDACNPCPPPSAVARRASPWVNGVTSLPPEVAMHRHDVVPRLAELTRDLLRHRDAAVLAAGAADGHRHEALALAEVTRDHAAQQLDVGVDELAGAVLSPPVAAPLPGPSGPAAELGDQEGGGEEAQVGDDVGVERDAVIEDEADKRKRPRLNSSHMS